MMQYPRIVLSAVLAKLIFSVIIALEKAAGLLPEIKKFRLRGITMLTQRRQELILQYVREHGSITVTQLRDMLDTSESTIRRDITALDREGKLVKVFGGAVDIRKEVTTHEYTVAQKSDLNREEKQRIARYAASLIGPEDFVYLDAGTTTVHMLDFMDEHASYVTNGVLHAQRLAARGVKALLVGGELKASTEAVIGALAMQLIGNYHFTKGFFGSNGVTIKQGCTTPDAGEALVKQTAIAQCRQSYVLCDSSKFDAVSSVTFAPFRGTTFITDRISAGYENCSNIIVASE